MGVFLATAAYGETLGSSIGQNALYTYYNVSSPIDVSIPQWTIRVLNTITASAGFGGSNPIGNFCYCANAQYSSASFGGAQQSPTSTRIVSGSNIASFGLVGKIVSYASGGLFTDEFVGTTGSAMNSTNTCVYGTGATIYTSILRDFTKFSSTYNTWGNQPWNNKCATYTLGSATGHQFVSCSTGTATTSSASDVQCVREWAWSGAGTTSLTITNYYSASCGTY